MYCVIYQIFDVKNVITMSWSGSQTVSWATAAIGCGRVFVSLWLLLETVRFWTLVGNFCYI